ncbi:hypothetical protein HYT56_01790 [Candidatus Woesearchaeota archaeon]|nr:hypothetical protein [Candidatus Woesearchaeota archaeon]
MTQVALALAGSSSSIPDFRFGLGYITFNSTDSSTAIQAFGDEISSNIAGSGEGRLSQLQFNFRPSAPVLNSPANNSIFGVVSEFSWFNSTDPEKRELSYLFEIWNDSSLQNILFINYSIKEQADPTSAIPDVSPEGEFYWRVAANDSVQNSTFSELRTVTIDVIPPQEFNLTSPDGTSSTDTTPTLDWEEAVDPTLQNYTIEVSTAADFSTITRTEYSTADSLTNWSTGSLEQGTYYWRVNATDIANNQRQSSNNLSFTVTASVTETITSTETSVSGGGTKPFTLNIIAPEGITIHSDDTITIPLLVSNPSTIILRGISLEVISDNEDILASIDKIFIPEIGPNSEEKLLLTINTKDVPLGSYGITIKALVNNPLFQDTFKLFANLLERDAGAASDVSDSISLAKQLFSGNPECLDLSEYISEAESALQKGEYEKSKSLAENAVEACNKLVTSKNSFNLLTGQATIIDKIKSQFKSKTLQIIAPQVLVLLVLIIIISKHLKKKRKNKYNNNEFI